MAFGGLVGTAASVLTLEVAGVEARAHELIASGELAALAPPGAPEALVFRAALFAAESAVATAILQLVERAPAPGPDPPAQVSAPPARDTDPLDCLDVLGEAPPEPNQTL